MAEPNPWQRTPVLRLKFSSDDTLNFNWSKIDDLVADAFGPNNPLRIPPNTITGDMIVDGSITDADIASVNWAKIIGAPSGGTGTPIGPAGGDLNGGADYPNPIIGPGKVTRAKTAADLWLPPIPVAGDVGKILGVAAGPTLAYQSGVNPATGTTTKYSRRDQTGLTPGSAAPTDGTEGVLVTSPAHTYLGGLVLMFANFTGSTYSTTAPAALNLRLYAASTMVAQTQINQGSLSAVNVRDCCAGSIAAASLLTGSTVIQLRWQYTQPNTAFYVQSAELTVIEFT